ncbi:MAG: cation transporter [Ruminococcus sp.]|nr:cation transporter [Ruminococcus sp.]
MLTQLLIKKCIRNHADTKNIQVRKAYGTLSSIVGIVCNVLLFLLKYAMGTLSGSISIISDAFNNLSDSASCLVTLFGYKLAAKPADKDHPFGHGRVEYLTSMIIAVLIMLMGFELLRDSAEKIMHPQPVAFRAIVLISLLCSIGMKLWMSVFNTHLGKCVNSSVMLATAKDSRSDVIATSVAALALIASCFTDLPIDGFAGILVSLFILKAGFEIIRDTLDDLLGRPADAETVHQIEALVKAHDKIIDIHDLMIHNYGPGHMLGSCHVEVRSDEDFCAIHDLVDHIEKRIWEEMHISMTIHMDPIETDNEQINRCKNMMLGIIRGLDPRLSLHDFRMVPGETHTNVIFDLVVPFECTYKNAQLKAMIDTELHRIHPNYYTVITFDCQMVER